MKLFSLFCLLSFLFHNSVLFAVILFHNFLFQDRLKKLKSQHGTVPVGNITVDMVWILRNILELSQLILLLTLLHATFLKGTWWNERDDWFTLGNLTA